MDSPVVIDSSVLVAFFVPSDSNNTAARNTINRLFDVERGSRVVIPPLVLYETAVVVTRLGYNEDLLTNRLFKLINLPNVVSTSLNEMAVFKHARLAKPDSKREPSLRTHDLLIVATALDFQATLASFDHNMNNCCQRLGVAVFS